MSKNEFDDLLLRKFQEEDFPYKKSSWERLSQLLPPAGGLPKADLKRLETRRKVRRIALGIAAGLAILLTGVLATRFLKPEAVPNEVSLADISEKETPEVMQQPAGAAAPADKPEKTPTSPLIAQTGRNPIQPKTVSGRPTAPRAEQTTANRHRPSPVTTERINQTDELSPAGSLATAAAAVPHRVSDSEGREGPGLAQPDGSTPPVNSPETLTRAWSGQDKKNYYNSLLNSPVEPEPAGGRTTVSVGGGVNYGTLNTGYALGLSARQKVGDRFFVEGSVGMLYNNNARNVADYGTISGFFTAARPSSANAMKLNSPAISPVENLYYFQVNPAVGYEINQQFSVSVGGDLQHLITADAESPKVQYSAEEVRIFPVLDFGLTGKTEFSISPEIQAGIVYREGLSAWLKSDPGTSYLNRRYIQVQFKYSLPLGK